VTFQGVLRHPRKSQAQEVTLVLEEAGPGAIRRPQRIPLLIPPSGVEQATVTSEAHSYGLNRELLGAIAATGGGVYDLQQDRVLFYTGVSAPVGQAFWPWLLVLASVAYLGAFAARRLEQ
jgi:hypothetical protein